MWLRQRMCLERCDNGRAIICRHRRLRSGWQWRHEVSGRHPRRNATDDIVVEQALCVWIHRGHPIRRTAADAVTLDVQRAAAVLLMLLLLLTLMP